MKTIKTILIACFFAVFALQSHAYEPAQDGAPSSGEMIVDTFLVRPLSIVGVAVGFTTWIVSLPFSVTGENAQYAGEVFVEEPLNYTFNRPLGEF